MNRDLLVVDFKTECNTFYTKESLLSYICNGLNQPYEVYHSSDNASIYAYLKNTSKDGVFVSFRLSDHDILSRNNVACLGGADVEIVFEQHHDLDDLDEKIEDLKFNIEEYDKN
jgi:hypothetical protein